MNRIMNDHNRYRPELDGFRGLSALLVFIAHVGVPGTLEAGAVGVTMFFVLSGYLITSLLIKEKANAGSISIWRFYARRGLRLFPALWLYICIVCLLSPLHRQLSYLLPVFFYHTNISLLFGRELGWFDHLWSLSLEEQFYIMWPCVVFFFLSKDRTCGLDLRRFCFGIWIVSVSLRLLLWCSQTPTRAIMYRPDASLFGLGIGAWLAVVFSISGATPSHSCKKLAYLSLTGILLLSGGLRLLPYGVSLLADYRNFLCLLLPLVSLFSVLFILSVESAPELRILNYPPLRIMGKISYGFYIWHLVIVDISKDYTWYVRIPGAFLLTFIISLTSYKLFEEPLLKLKKHLH